MTPAENILSRLSKDDLIHLALDYQENQNIAFDKITKELTEIRKGCSRVRVRSRY